jgi:hypothetical protein
MSLRRKSDGSFPTPVASPVNKEPSMMEQLFREKAAFNGPVGTLHDVPDVSAVQTDILTYTMGVTTSDSNNEEEWDKDLDKILSMFVSRPGNVELMKRTDDGPVLTEISIGIDQAKKEMTIMNLSTHVKTFPFEEKDELMKFLKNHIKTVMNLKLVDTFFRAFL